MGQGSRRRRRRSRREAREQEQQQQQRTSQPRQRSGIKATIDSFGGFLTIGAVVIGIVVVGALIFANRPGGSSSVGDGDFEARDRAAPTDGRVLGDPDAPVRIVAYEDFSCPHCGEFTEDTEPLLEEEFVNEGVVAFEFRHMAILGADSERAAAAAECAADQNLFWPYHDILFLRQGTAGWASNGNLKDFAREVNDALDGDGLDLGAFDECVDSGAKELIVEASTDEGADVFIGLTGRASTPSFLINGQPLQGAQPIEVFREMIDSLAQPDEAAAE